MLTNRLKSLRPNGIRGWLVLSGIVVILLALLPVIADAALSYNRIHAGVHISGLDVGRMTKPDATAVMAVAADEAQDNPIELTSGEQSWTVEPGDLGTEIDIEESIKRAYAFGRNEGILADLGTRFSLYLSERNIPLHGTVETEKLDDLTEEIGTALDEPAVNASLRITDGKVSIVDGEEGLVVDREKLRSRIKDTLFSLHSTEIHIPMKITGPNIQATDTDRAVGQAETMVSAPVRLVFERMEWKLTPKDIQSYIGFQVEGEGEQASLVPYISAEKAEAFLQQVAADVDRPPKDATWETNGETAEVVPHVSGLKLDPEATANALTRAALSSTNRLAEARGQEVLPERTTEDAKAMGITAKLASFKTEFGGSSNRRHNVQLAARLINDTLIAPGENFDFNTVVGPRTTANGFKTAPVIINGKLEDSLGGGICQVSTTLFNAAFFAGLDITSRRNHSLYISHYPKGRDATVSWGGPEFRFKNDTDDYILVRSAATPSSVLFVIYGDPEGRKVDYTTSNWYNVRPPQEKKIKNDELPPGETKVVENGQTGRQVTVGRTVTRDGEILHEDKFVSSYPMRPKIIEVGPTTTTTTLPTTPTTAPAATTTTTTSP